MGRTPLPDTDRYEISKMWDVHHEIVRLALSGAKAVDIAAMLNVSTQMVSYTLNSTIVKRQLSLMRAARDLDSIDIAKRIQEIAMKAVERMDRLVESDDEKVALPACKDILDRAGHGAVKKVAVEGRHMVFSGEDLLDIQKRAKEVAMENGIIDVEVSQ